MFALGLTSVFVLPIFLVRSFPRSLAYRRGLFAVVIGVVSVFALMQRMSLAQMGFRTDTLLAALVLYIPCTLVSIFVLRTCARVIGTRWTPLWREDVFFVPVALLLSVAQQFLYQGFLLQTLSDRVDIGFAIVLTAVAFGLLHTIFPRPWFSFVLTFFGGMMFASLFVIVPNLYVASVAHLILNLVAVQYGFVTYLGDEKDPQSVI